MTARRLTIAAAATAAVAVAAWLLWPYLVGAGVMFAAWRVLTRGTRRHRPKSSWSSLGRTAALMFAAWNSRWLKPATQTASVRAKVGAEHDPARWNDDEGGSFGELPEGY